MDKTEKIEEKVGILERKISYLEQSYKQTTQDMLDFIGITQKTMVCLTLEMCFAVVLMGIVSIVTR